MASTAITKTQQISDFRIRKEESIYERLQRLTQGALRVHSDNGLNYNSRLTRLQTIDQKLQAQKDKAIRHALLHAGNISY